MLTALSFAQADEAVYRPSPAMALYLVKADAAPEPLALRLYRGNRPQGDRITLRLFDPEENLVLRQHLEPGQEFLHTLPGSGEIEGIPLPAFDAPARPHESMATTRVVLDAPGIWQARVVGGDHNTVVHVDLDASVRRGVSFQNGRFTPWRNDLSQAWFYIPRNARRLTLRGVGVEAWDHLGERRFPPEEYDPKGPFTIDLEATDVVWTLRFADPATWHFVASGIPLILTEDEATARAIGGSVEVLDDGTVVAHRFQRRLAELLPRLLEPANVGDTEELIALFDSEPEQWLEGNPLRNQLLRQPYGFFPHLLFALREQLLDPESHWAGTIGKAVWAESLAATTPEDRWDSFLGVHHGQGRSGTSSSAYAKYLADAYTLDAPFNPYRGRREVLYRAAAAAFRDLMLLNESEIFPGAGSDLDTYPGMPGFVYGGRHFPEFAKAAPHLPEEIREAWAAGLRRIVDRHWPDGLVSCRNQSSHFLVAWQNFALGTGEAADADLARRFAARFARTAMPAGYHREAGGPCGTYPGIQHFYMAEYYRLSGDAEMLESIRRSYRFYNHTVAPEPDGRVFGGYNYTHRTPRGFHQEQYGGARRILADILPEVGLWAPEPPSEAEQAKSAEALQASVGRPFPEKHHCLELNLNAWRYWTETPNRSGVWPAREKASFVRDFGGELIAVKRPGWYAAFYVGKPAGSPFYLYGAHGGTRPLPDHAEDAGGDMWATYTTKGTARAFNNGGLTLFWTPDYGNAMLAGKTALTRHGLVAFADDNTRHAEDYFRVAYQLDESAGTLRCTGQMENLPLAYERLYTFHDDHLQVDLKLTASGDVTYRRLVENLPVAGGSCKSAGVTIAVDGDESAVQPEGVDEALGARIELATAATASASLTDDDGRGLDIIFDKARPIRLCRSGLVNGDIQHNRLEIELPATLAAGDTLTLSYQLIPRR